MEFMNQKLAETSLENIREMSIPEIPELWTLLDSAELVGDSCAIMSSKCSLTCSVCLHILIRIKPNKKTFHALLALEYGGSPDTSFGMPHAFKVLNSRKVRAMGLAKDGATMSLGT